MLKVLSLFLMFVSSAAVFAQSAPSITVSDAGTGSIRIAVQQADAVDGYNVYFNGDYVSTHRLTQGSDEFTFDGVAGTYCVASFASVNNETTYSACSASVNFTGSDNNASTNASTPSAPGNFRAQIYSSTAAELFWDASTDNGFVQSYEITRNTQVIANVDGRSYFERALTDNTNFTYAIVAIDNEGNRSTSQTLVLNTNSRNDQSIDEDNNSEGNNYSSVSVPGNLRGTFYSSTAAELFWDEATADSGVASYEIRRNGTVLDQRDARSYYESAIDRNQSYDYEVVAIDFNGNRGNAAQLTLGGGNSASGSSTIDEPAQSDQLTLQLSADRFTLQEGADSSLYVPFSVQRSSGNTRAVNLSIRAENTSDAADVSYQIQPANLAQNESGALLEVRLSVGVAPINFHERRFILSASDGDNVQEAFITFDVKPTNAPDIYLLIGQSNMEGSSETDAKNTDQGGADELNDRIKQLNVTQNSTDIFQQDHQFTDEIVNISSPRYITAEDPLHEPRAPGRTLKEAQFIGMGLSFAKAALPDTTREIYLVPAAWSATGFCSGASDGLSWNAAQTPESFLGGTLLTDRALTRLNMTLRDTNGVFRGILWHQGEADSNNNDCALAYNQNLQKLVARIRTDALQDSRGAGARGPDANIPLVVGTMSKGNDERGSFSDFGGTKLIIDSVHRNIATSIPYADFSNNDDLLPPAYPCGAGSCIHFGAAAYRLMGSRYNDALRRIISR